MDAGGSEIVHQSGLNIADEQRRQSRSHQSPQVVAMGVGLPRGPTPAGGRSPRSISAPFTLVLFSAQRSVRGVMPSTTRWPVPALRALSRPRDGCRSRACSMSTSVPSSMER